MAEKSNIAWTDGTFNPWRGCSKVHTGCKHCYAEMDFSCKTHGIKWGSEEQGGVRMVAADSTWRKPLAWNRKAHHNGVRSRVFCASLADVFEDWRGDIVDHNNICVGRGLGEQRSRLYDLWDATPWLDWLVLTKRPENIGKMLDIRRPNVHLGVSVSDQETADKAIAELLNVRLLTNVGFVSAEPLLGPITCPPGYLWWIVGGESGPKARACNVKWIQSIVSQCRDAAVPCFVKQLGAKPMVLVHPHGPCDLDLKHPKGGDPSEWPEELRVQEFPVKERT